MSYLNESHPEIFFALPRPGGIAKIEETDITISAPGKGSKSTIRTSRSSKSRRSTASSRSGRSRSIFEALLTSTPKYVCRDARVRAAMETSPWVLFDEDTDMSKPPNPMQDSIDILAVVITTVMLLAAGHADISKDHLRWTLSYLECVNDEYGSSPPNIRGILNHIKKMDESLVSFNENVLQETEIATESPETQDEAAAE